MAGGLRARNEGNGNDIVDMCSFSGGKVEIYGNDRPACWT